jgi:hypothetical protein
MTRTLFNTFLFMHLFYKYDFFKAESRRETLQTLICNIGSEYTVYRLYTIERITNKILNSIDKLIA